MADKQILVTGSADAPAGYTIPNTVEVIPKSVRAVFDGTGASGNFVPLLQVVSDGGVVVAESPGSTVTAGGSVAQSWFQGAVSSGALSALNIPWGYCRMNYGILASSSSLTQIDFNPGVVSGVGYTSGDASITFGDNGTGRYSLILNSTGFYLIASGASFGISGAAAANSVGYINSVWSSGGNVTGGKAVDLFAPQVVAAQSVANPGFVSTYNADGSHQTVPHAGNTQILQNSGANSSGNVWQFACYLSSVSVGQGQ